MAFLPVFFALAANAAPSRKAFPLESLSGIHAVGVRVTAEEHRGKRALRVVGLPDFNGDQLAILEGSDIDTGVIEADVGGRPLPGASAGARGFAGIAFRTARDGSTYECFYIRPTNGRSDDQVRRNHSVQYIAVPGFAFDTLRKEAPERYESYVDLVPEEWTHLRIEIETTKARLYVHSAAQPTLVVNDMKLPLVSGAVALWIGDETEAWFRDVVIRPLAPTPAR